MYYYDLATLLPKIYDFVFFSFVISLLRFQFYQCNVLTAISRMHRKVAISVFSFRICLRRRFVNKNTLNDTER